MSLPLLFILRVCVLIVFFITQSYITFLFFSTLYYSPNRSKQASKQSIRNLLSEECPQLETWPVLADPPPFALLRHSKNFFKSNPAPPLHPKNDYQWLRLCVCVCSLQCEHTHSAGYFNLVVVVACAAIYPSHTRLAVRNINRLKKSCWFLLLITAEVGEWDWCCNLNELSLPHAKCDLGFRGDTFARRIYQWME